jgi:hypothetical protein
MINYHNENEYLEFKLIEYREEIKGNLIKDVIALANANHIGDRYIIIGLKKHTGEIEFKDVENPQDSATVQQYIHENIEPPLDVTYEPFSFEEHKLVLLTILEPGDQPYHVVRDIGNGKAKLVGKNDSFIRKGSYQVRVSRKDLDRMFAKKYELSGLEGKMELTFDNGSREIQVPCIRHIRLPSDEEKVKIEKEIHLKDRLPGPDFLAYVEKFQSSNEIEDRYKAMSLPDLRYRLGNVKMNFHSEDVHYLFETRAFKLNLSLKNNGEKFLEKGLLRLIIPVTKHLTVVETISLNTYHISVPAFAPVYDYPEVKTLGDHVSVTYEIGDVRHGMIGLVYKDALRLSAFEQLAGAVVKVEAQLLGANLRELQSFELVIKFV